MAKQVQPRRLADSECRAVLRSIKGSAQKARYVLDMIKGKPVEQALAALRFCPKGKAEDVTKLLSSAIANAENNHQLSVDDLYVKEAFADKSIVMKRFRARARGRAAKIMKPRCHMTVVVAEKMTETKTTPAKKAETKSGGAA